MADLAISCSRLSKTYRLGLRARKVEALADLDLAVAPGSVYGFVGPNGAGKSTTIKVLVGLVRASAGSATLFGTPVDDPRARLTVGYLPENPSFHDFMRPLEVMRYLGRLSGLSGADLDRRALALLERVGLGHALDLSVRKFSKGMVQRLGLAQALVHDPPLLVLDEPMSGLDPIGRKEVRDLVVELGRQGKTIFFSTHILSDVESICDRVGMLLKGRLVREGTLGSLLDGTVRAVELRCAGLDAAAVAEVRALALDGGPSPDGQAFTFATLEAANAGAARVQARGGQVLLLSPHRETLEETFVRLAQAVGERGG
ncbi:MAG: ABC transporter ATP-binding protein [Anaeromyxobacter sp.]|nr:ABC transporter ATP-binding protein [Anaeromyxobacter sp.]MBL0275749.1 ABC transporter ATP-binding protein [Anaeromyxobacter sp.]